MCEIDFVVRAPDGKEVEELTRKDIIKALRAKIPIDQVTTKMRNGGNGNRFGGEHQRMQMQHQQPVRAGEQRPAMQHDNQFRTQPVQPQPQRDTPAPDALRQQEMDRSILSPSEISRKMLNKKRESQTFRQEPMRIDPELGIKDITGRGDPSGLEAIPSIDRREAGQGAPSGAVSGNTEQRYIDSLTELHNTLRGRLYGSDGSVVSEVPIRELIQTIQDSDSIDVIVFDGIITQRLIELANKKGVRAIYGIRSGQVSRMFDKMLLYTKEQGSL